MNNSFLKKLPWAIIIVFAGIVAIIVYKAKQQIVITKVDQVRMQSKMDSIKKVWVYQDTLRNQKLQELEILDKTYHKSRLKKDSIAFRNQLKILDSVNDVCKETDRKEKKFNDSVDYLYKQYMLGNVTIDSTSTK